MTSSIKLRIYGAGVFLLVGATIQAARAQVTLIAHAASATGGTTPAINTTGGNFAAICGKANLTATDSKHNHWEYINSKGGAGGSTSGIYIAFDLATSANQTFSVTGGTPFAVMVFNHVASGPDQMASNDGPSYPLKLGPVQPKSAHQLIIACDNSVFNADSRPADTLNPPFTAVDLAVQPADGSRFLNGTTSAYGIVGSATADGVRVDFNSNQANGQAATMATFFTDQAPAPFVSTTPAQVPEGVLGHPYKDAKNSSVCLSTSGGVHPLSWSQSSGTLPPGIAFNATNGCLEGQPKQPAPPTELSFTAKDAQGHTLSIATHLAVVASPMMIASQTYCPDGTQLKPYKGCNLANFVSGGSGSYVSFTIDTQNKQTNLPEGMSLDARTGAVSSSLIRGQGGYNPILTVKDSAGGEVSSQVNFHIDGDNSSALANPMPADSVWRLRVDTLPLDKAAYAQLFGSYLRQAFHADFGRYWFDGGMQITTVGPAQKSIPLHTGTIFYSEIDQTVTPCDAGIEGTWNYVGFPPGTVGDNHYITVQTGPHPIYQELYQTYPDYPKTTLGAANCSFFASGGRDMFGGAVQWDPASYNARGNGTPAADAGGLCLTCLLVKVEDLEHGPAGHPIRFTLGRTLAYHLFPATVQAGLGRGSCHDGWQDSSLNALIDPDNPPSCGPNTPHDVLNPMGEWYRLKAATSEPGPCAANELLHNLFLTFKQNGIILADNGSSSFIGISGTQDWRWPDDNTIAACLSQLHGSDLEPVNIRPALKQWPTSYQLKPEFVIAK